MEPTRQFLLNVIYKSDHIKQNTTFKEQLGMIQWIKKMSPDKLKSLVESNVVGQVNFATFDDLKEDTRGIEVRVPTPSPPVKRALSIGLSTATLVMPGGLIINAAAKYMLDSYNYKCELSCQKDESIKRELKGLCSNKCKVSSIAYVLAKIKGELGKCDATKNPRKCRKKLGTLVKNYTNKYAQAQARMSLTSRKAKMRGHM